MHRSEADLLARADRLFPGGCLGIFSLPKELRFVAAEGRGSKLYDVDGNEYIDYVLGSGPLILGHAHPAIVAAVADQLAKGSTFYALTERVILLAEKITKAVPCAEKIRFTSSGTEATFFALRFARACTGREKILKFEGGYHGYQDYAMMSAHPTRRRPFPESAPDSGGIPRSIGENVLIAPFNDLDRTSAIIEEHREKLAAVIVEPLQRFISPARGFLEGLRDATARHGVLLIFDEIVTGFRLAYGGAQEYYGVSPDMATFGKTISGGFPLAAVCGRQEVMDLCDLRHKGSPRYVHQSGTFNGNPLCAAAGYATLTELEKAGTYERLHRLGRLMREGLSALAGEFQLPAQVMGDGPMWHIVFTKQSVTDYGSTLDADAGRARKFFHHLLKNGIFVNPGARSYISLAHTEEDIARTLRIARGAFAAAIEEADAGLVQAR